MSRGLFGWLWEPDASARSDNLQSQTTHSHCDGHQALIFSMLETASLRSDTHSFFARFAKISSSGGSSWKWRSALHEALIFRCFPRNSSNFGSGERISVQWMYWVLTSLDESLQANRVSRAQQDEHLIHCQRSAHRPQTRCSFEEPTTRLGRLLNSLELSGPFTWRHVETPFYDA